MKKTWMAIALLVTAHACYGADYSITATTGYMGSFGFGVSGTVSHFAQGFPLSFEFGIAHTMLDPGNPEQARRIFINEATNGTPEKNGYTWDFSFNMLFPVRVMGMPDAHFYLGVRKTMFTAHFAYVGGNEIFDVTSTPWGFGTGLKSNFPMGRNVSFTLTAGIEYFPNDVLTGHDTTYYPDGEMVNQKEEYSYKDADGAINQPKIRPILMLGITLGL
jgi:hypothetical protein